MKYDIKCRLTVAGGSEFNLATVQAKEQLTADEVWKLTEAIQKQIKTTFPEGDVEFLELKEIPVLDMKEIRGECYKCSNQRNVPGNAHIACATPDPDMTGDPHGIKNGWFVYPWCFDPIWKTKQCVNFQAKGIGDVQ